MENAFPFDTKNFRNFKPKILAKCRWTLGVKLQLQVKLLANDSCLKLNLQDGMVVDIV